MAGKGFGGYQQDLDDEILAFQLDCYPDRNPQQILPVWNWMFVEPAQRLGIEPAVWVYRRKGEIAAHQGGMPVQVKVGEQLLITVWFVETMSRESARGLPIGPMLVKKALEDQPFNLSLGQTDYMRELQYKLGWQRIGTITHYVFVPTLGMDLSASLPPLLSKVAQVGIGLMHKIRFARHKRRMLDASWLAVERFDARHDKLWRNMAANVPCAVVRDAGYLNWKYIDRPDGDFHCFECVVDDDCIGIVVLICSEPDDVYSYQRGHIVDLVCDLANKTALDTLLTGAIERLLMLGAKNVNMLACNPLLERALTGYGFLQREARHQLLVAVPEGDSELSASLEASNWLLTMGDSDVDRFP